MARNEKKPKINFKGKLKLNRNFKIISFSRLNAMIHTGFQSNIHMQKRKKKQLKINAIETKFNNHFNYYLSFDIWQ